MSTDNVNLKDFIAKVIEDVHSGANEGKKRIHEPHYWGSEDTKIDFDLAITTTTDKNSNTNGQIAVSVLNLVNLQAKGQSEKGTIISQANRIHFTIPLILRESRKKSTKMKNEYNPLDEEAGY